MSGLSHAEQDAYTLAINAPGVRTGLRVQVQDLDHKPLGNLTGVAVGGQVDLQRKGEVNQSASIDLVDIDTDLSDLDLRHLIQVHHGALTPTHGWVWVPATCGWIAATRGDASTATLTLHDKSALGLLPGAPVRHWQEGAPLARVLRNMMEDIGETKFDIPKRLEEDGPRLTRDWESGGKDPKKAPTLVARRMAKGKLHVFHSTTGRFTVRRPMQAPAVTWKENRDGATARTGPMEFDRDLRTIRNVVVGTGRKKLRYRAVADADNLYSPRSLARGPAGNKVPLELTTYLDVDTARERELKQACEDELARGLRENIQARFECVPNFLAAQPWTLVHAEREDGRFAEMYLDEAGFPLVEGAATIGYRRARPRPRKSGKGLVLS